MATKKEPTFWSTSASGKSRSGGDAYSRRSGNKKATGQGCVVTLLVGASVAAGIVAGVGQVWPS